MKRAFAEYREPSIGAMWTAYRLAVLEPSGIEGVQLVESRRIFYLACKGMLDLLHQLPHQMSEDQACEVMEGLATECEVFIQKVATGEPGF